mgnify:CR=1 FL=1
MATTLPYIFKYVCCRLPLLALAACLLPPSASRAQTLREAFTAMPDSLLPTLTKNNRLDMLDFMDAKMKAAVTNKLDGETLMTHLSDDSLAMRMSDALTVEMRLLQADSTAVVCVKRTYTTAGGERQTLLNSYDAQTWRELTTAATVVESTLQRRDGKTAPDNP